MTIPRSDLDQAVLYLKYACELLEREAFAKTTILRKALLTAARRVGTGDDSLEDALADITELRQLCEQVPLPDARTEILKAVAVLRDKSR